MQKRNLGSTGIQVSPIGIGTTKFGRNQAVKFPQPFELPSDKQILNLLSIAREQGINLIDTAPSYGSSEERLGQLIRQRSDWIYATKTGEEFIDGNSVYDFTPEHAQFSIDRSLKRLRTDYLDLVLVHSDGNDLEIINHFGLLDFLADLKKAGKIRAFGMSTKTVSGGKLALQKSDAAMIMYNPLHTEEYPIIQQAAELNKGILIKKALMSGHIQNMPGTDPVHHALEFILKEPGVSSIILGTINPEHLLHAVNSAMS